ncbi:hypothetical protein [Jiangella anatolica]|uniref:Neutral/alkaline non-lysosomal ceramidase N-terminal domain-containing protein n=1 Tax=Jiangella anatolica TaxID=2670374 RepID=A0A2W2CTZ3_9ACTN|nr:hypothetical protein [Jiangella anatolica]PZF83633.1 hypothetical protein C1I92_11905 [Jiangella anatolica]
MRVGHGSATLAVPDGTPLGGYAARTAPSAGTLAPLRVDCVSIAAGTDRFLLVVAELVGVNADLAAEVRRRLAGIGETWLCATHTHSGPDVGSGPGGGTTPDGWLSAVADAAAAAARDAVAAEAECVASHRSGRLDGVGSRRGADTGDHRVPVDVLRLGGDRVAGVLAVVPVHPTVLPASSSVVSGDLTAWIRDELRDRLGGSAWVVVATGAAGDVSTRWTRHAQTEADGRRLAALAADQLAELVTMPGRVWTADDGIAAARATLPLPARHDDGDLLTGLRAEFTGRLAGLADDDPAGRAAVTALQGVEAAARRVGGPETVPLELAAVRLGGLTLQGIGGEPFLSLRDTAAPSVLLGYANGYAGYLPAAADFDTPGYEVLISPFRPDAAERAAGVLHELVHRITHGG